MLIVRDTRKRWTDVLQKLAEDKVALQRRRDILKRTVQDLGSQYEALKTQLSENETYVQVVIDVIDLIELLPLPQVAYVDVHLKFIIYIHKGIGHYAIYSTVDNQIFTRLYM